MRIKFKKTVIVGPGLIGGSMGLVLRKLKIADQVVGVARHKSTLVKAKKKQSITQGVTDLKKAVIDADLIILATPVMAIKQVISSIKDIVKKDCIIIDVGSTKTEIVGHAEKILPDNVHFIGTHPMAGSEKAGAEFADECLFNDSICFIVKTERSNREALSAVNNLWRIMGARTVVISAGEHDKIVAQISHLPHLVSVALVDCVRQGFIKFAASGFKDTTRIAAGDPQIWKDISFSNKQAILEAISGFEARLSRVKKAIRKDQKQALLSQLSKVKKKRDSLK